MSNKTQLQTNNTTLDGYIARVNTAKDVTASLPEAGNGGSGGGGSGSVETCTVKFNGSSSVFANVSYVAFENEKVITYYIATPENNLILENVICGTNFSFTRNGVDYTVIPSDDTQVNLINLTELIVYNITASNGDIVNLSVIYFDV